MSLIDLLAAVPILSVVTVPLTLAIRLGQKVPKNSSSDSIFTSANFFLANAIALSIGEDDFLENKTSARSSA